MEIVICLLVIMFLLFGLGFWVMEIGIRLFFGWTIFLYRNLLKLRIDPTSILCIALQAAGALILGRYFLHSILPRAQQQGLASFQSLANPMDQWRLSALALLLIIVGFFTGLSAVSIVHQVGWMLNSPVPVMSGGVTEAARSMQSSHHLKQMTLSRENWGQSHAQVFSTQRAVGASAPHGWQTRLLPYIEEFSVYESISQDRAWNHSSNYQALSTPIIQFMIPSYTTASKLTDGYASSHYSISDRLMTDQAIRSLADIEDGQSSTILMGESCRNLRPWGHPAVWMDPALPINRSRQGLSSPFKGGANVSFCDGAVRFLSQDIDPVVLEAIATPNGGEKATLIDMRR